MSELARSKKEHNETFLICKQFFMRLKLQTLFPCACDEKKKLELK